jgi:hypothetical protein
MTIGELIEQLEDIKEQVGEHAECRFASQPQWAFENSIYGVHALTKDERKEMAIERMRDEGMDEDEIKENFDEEELEQEEDVVYLEEGSQIGYLPDEAKELIGW